MGNCCEPASSMEWDGHDWSDLMSKKTSSTKVFDEAHGLSLGKVQKEKLMGSALRASPDANGKVKIKISKKQLAELLENQQQQVINNNNNNKQLPRASAEQVLLRLIKARRDHHHARHGFWKPVLKSIPEVS
ncbi:hypothetical protein VNO78_22563 [Psophocarpus tetragonolobus]|uniref:Uncharacterized protein n=1 Tax=Psophocarpus tetragonolobus TaxID=3891 RepID=A0AAN9S2K4_PSOTE